MAQRIVMPSFGMYTAEGNFGRWFRPAGSRVEAGEVIADLVTEKATYEVESPFAGILHPFAEEGASLQVEGLIGWILEEGEEPPEEAGGSASAAKTATLAPPAPSRDGERLRASPLARRIAAERGIDLTKLTGSGPMGRIVEADVQAALIASAGTESASSAPQGASASASPAPPGSPWRIRQRLPLTGTRKTIAERLRRTVDTAVSLTLTRETRVEALVEARAALRQSLGADVPYDALLLKAFAAALREHPDLLAMIEGDEILYLDDVHLGFAASVPGGLVVPVVRDVDRRPVAEIATSIRDLARKAKEGGLRPPDLMGGTATLSNLGGYGVDAFTPILNPPQSAILGVGRIAQRPVVEGRGIAIGTTCVLSLTFDHRVADGAPAALLLDAIARKLGDPVFFAALA